MDYRTILLERIEHNATNHESAIRTNTDKVSVRLEFARLLESRAIALQLEIAFNDIENAELTGRNHYHRLKRQEIEDKGYSIHNL